MQNLIPANPQDYARLQTGFLFVASLMRAADRLNRLKRGQQPVEGPEWSILEVLEGSVPSSVPTYTLANMRLVLKPGDPAFLPRVTNLPSAARHELLDPQRNAFLVIFPHLDPTHSNVLVVSCRRGDTIDVQLQAKMKKSICAFCYALTPSLLTSLKKCGGCLSARYCSPECQKAAWKAGHKAECKMLK